MGVKKAKIQPRIHVHAQLTANKCLAQELNPTIVSSELSAHRDGAAEMESWTESREASRRDNYVG